MKLSPELGIAWQVNTHSHPLTYMSAKEPLRGKKIFSHKSNSDGQISKTHLMN